MAEHIQSDGSFILKQHQLATSKLQRAVDQLATGDRLLRPGDDAAAYAEVQRLDFGQATDAAKSLTVQTRLSWYQTSSQFMGQILDILSAMSENVVQAKGSLSAEKDIEVLDATFQKYKEQVAQIVDGKGGENEPTATFQEKPLFIGFSPTLEIGAQVTTPLNGAQDVSLYTGYGRGGFSALTLRLEGSSASAVTISGTAAGGNTTHIVLDESASSQDDVYVGMSVSITGGSGAGETAQVASYDGESRTATFVSPVGTILDGSSQYTLTASNPNNGLAAVEGFSSVSFAEEVWGADNDRLERLTPGAGSFRALTAEETAYRTANSIPDSDMEAKTFEEKEARRKLNIFDSEYGNLLTKENADRMYTQVNNAITQISVFLQRHDSRAATLQSQLQELTGRQLAQQEGSEALGQVDAARVAAEFQELSLEPEKLLSLASRLQDNLGRLNDLVQNKGTR